MKVKCGLLTVLVLFLGTSFLSAASTEEANQILDATGIKGGLVVHIGCGDGRLTAALHASNSYLVHGLDRNAKNVKQAREYIKSIGLYGKVSVEQLKGDRLPYIDNLVNLVVSENLGTVPMAEVVRVLCPNGVAYIRQGGRWINPPRWIKTVKQRPKEIDDWTHYLHDSSNNAVAADTRIGHPQNLQWQVAPTWIRNHHYLASISSLVSSGGRIFYVVDETSGHDMSLPGQWSLQARDAFNGILLWKRPIENWVSSQRGFRSGPMQIARTLVACSDYVYTLLGVSGPIAQIDAASGKTVRVYEETQNAEEFLLEGDQLFVLAADGVSENAMPLKLGFNKHPNTKKLFALDTKSGKILWSWKAKRIEDTPIPQTLAVSGDRVFFAGDDAVFCFDRNSGKKQWQTGQVMDNHVPSPWYPQKAKSSKKHVGRMNGWSVATLVALGDAVVFSNGKAVTRLDAATGQALWQAEGQAGTLAPIDIFIIAKQVWVGSQPLLWAEGGYTAYDLDTGKKVTSHLDDLKPVRSIGHHHRCYRDKATSRFIIDNHRGIEMLDLDGDDHSRNNWIRGLCQYGVMPANGLIYCPPHACGCYPEAKLFGFLAVASSRTKRRLETKTNRLEKGPAYGKVSGAAPAKNDWPTLRGGNDRAGVTAQALPAKLGKKWDVYLGRCLTAPVAADGVVLSADMDTHIVYALDASTGAKKWFYTAGGRIDSPPTIHDGMALFGCRDGWVYSLRLSDGSLVWRFRAAPADLRTNVMDQLESLWPVFGSVLIHKGLVYFAAGRNSYLDDGMFLYALDPKTGKVVYQKQMNSPSPRIFSKAEETKLAKTHKEKTIKQNRIDYKTFAAADKSDSFSMQGGSLNDILSSDGEHVFLRFFTFNAEWEQQDGKASHLFSTSSFIDDNENHRSHWVLGQGNFSRLPVAYPWLVGKPGAELKNQIVGLMMSLAKGQVWSVQRSKNGYLLFSQEYKKEEALKGGANDTVMPTSKRAWQVNVKIRPRAIVKSGKRVFLLGMPLKTKGPDTRTSEQTAGMMQFFSADTGAPAGSIILESPPVWDGVAVAAGKMYISTENGSVVCLGL